LKVLSGVKAYNWFEKEERFTNLQKNRRQSISKDAE
jgi:hypothetical protein